MTMSVYRYMLDCANLCGNFRQLKQTLMAEEATCPKHRAALEHLVRSFCRG
jgi:hypothetical protein